jgi:DNA invertase Pin-like site-specific DNA recombinase
LGQRSTSYTLWNILLDTDEGRFYRPITLFRKTGAKRMGKSYGYARVSTEDQELGLQITALRDAGVPEANIVQEKASGKAGTDRPLYDALLRRLGDGDRLVVWKVDRLGRSTLDALTMAKNLDDRGVHIVITTLGVDLKTPAGRLVFGMMSQISEFERELIRERVKAGMTEARKRGIHTGRKHTLTPSQRAEAARMHHCDGKSLAEIAALFGCGRSVVHRAVQEAGSTYGLGKLAAAG